MEENNNETNEIKQEQVNIDNEGNHRKRPFKKWKRKDENQDFKLIDKKVTVAKISKKKIKKNISKIPRCKMELAVFLKV